MAMETPAGTLIAPVSAAALPKRSLGGLIAISIFWFALNFHWVALPTFLIPAQVFQLLLLEAPGSTLAQRADWADAHKALALAIVTAPGLIVALITNPFFGLLSDRTRGRFGRRRPYILIGTLINLVGLGLMALAPVSLVQNGSGNVLGPGLLLLTFGLMVTQFANNAAAAPFHALLPDLVPAEQRGFASGVMGMAYWFGTISGSAIFFVLAVNIKSLGSGIESFAQFQGQVVIAYAIVALVILVMAVLSCLFVHEQPYKLSVSEKASKEWRRTVRELVVTLAIVSLIGFLAWLFFRLLPQVGATDRSVNIVLLITVVAASIGAARAFDFHPRRNPDFTWVVVTRLLLMIGVYLVLDYLQYYMKDVAGSSNPDGDTSKFLIALTITAAISTAVAGWASDRVGRKRMVYFCGAFMVVVGVAFVLAPYLLPGHVLEITLIAGAIFGLGFGAYVSVDWALVTDVLPNEETFAQDMGIWNIGLTASGVLGLVLGAQVIALGTGIVNQQFGYTLLFVSFVIFCVLGTVTVRYIKGVPR